MKLLAILGLALALACGAGAAEPIRAVQLDLARQKEPVGFVKAYLRQAQAAGYNTVLLYLEDRIKTAGYPCPTDEESYLPDEVRDIVSTGTALGLDLVPVVSPLGHTERFLRHPEMRRFGEQGGGVGRFGPCENPGCFCLEDPEARAWMERYLTEVAALFPGKNFHLGFDETFNLGFCTRCRPIMDREGLAALYLKHVVWAHDVAKRLGKRMWMWEDFFDFFPEELAKVPKDVLMCCWNYSKDIEATGPRGHFGGRLRRDVLTSLERLGLDALVCVCPWPENVQAFAEYASTRKTCGFAMTQWEMAIDFHGFFLPRILAAVDPLGGAVPADGDWLKRGLRRSLPSLDDTTLELVCGLAFDVEKLRYRAVSEGKILNGAGDPARLHYWQAALERLRLLPSEPGRGTIPSDPLSEAATIEDLTMSLEMILLSERTRSVARILYLPERTKERSAAAKAALAEIKARWTQLVGRRQALWAAWRPGCTSEKLGKYLERLPKTVDAACARPDVAAADEWLMEVDLAMIDTHAAPQWTVEVPDANGWRTLASGSWKPRMGGPGYSPHLESVTLGAVPERLRLSCKGYGAGSLCHISLRNRDRRLVPVRVLKSAGEVRDAQNLLTDDLGDCRLGLPDCTETVLQPHRADAVAVVELALGTDCFGLEHK